MTDEIHNSICKLKSLDLKTYPYNEIISNIKQVGDIGMIEEILFPGRFVFRARQNGKDEQFYSKCQLTYKPQQFNKTCQRASTPNMTMFYGSVLPEEINENDLDEVRVAPIFEAVPWLRDKTVKGKRTITFSKWKVTQDIRLIAIIQHGNFYDKSSYTKKLMNHFEKFLNKHPEKKEGTKAFCDFISGEFAKEVDSKHDYDYLISAAFTEMIVEFGYDGVLYPSVQVDGKGFNVAITPFAADNKLQLEGVIECTAYKLYENTVLDNDRIAVLQPNQLNFEYEKVEDEYHEGELNCIKKLGLNSVNDLN